MSAKNNRPPAPPLPDAAPTPARKPAATVGRKATAGTTAGHTGKVSRKAPAPATATEVQAPAMPAPPKVKLVRDSFTIPKAEYLVLDQLKLRAAKLGRPTKKSELIRAGIKALAVLGDAPLLGAIARVPSLKTGRPQKTPPP